MELCHFIQSLSKNDVLVALAVVMPLFLSKDFDFMLPFKCSIKNFDSIPAVKSLDNLVGKIPLLR